MRTEIFGFVLRRATARAAILAVAAVAVCLVFAPPAAAADPQEGDAPPVTENPTAETPSAEAPSTETQAPETQATGTQAAEPAPAAEDPGSDLDRAQATMGRILEVGRALHAWARDTRLERGRKQPTGRLPRELRWDRCPGIGHAELVELLVPAYLREVPAEDSWGRPLQFCLERRLNGANQQYGVRSAGNDGAWENDPYQVGGFPETRLGGDLVWMDGYFLRWPEPQ